MNCKNCGQQLNGNFCRQCGQKAKIDTINASYILNEVSDTFLQVNHGLFFTIKELYLRPGISIRDYLEGKRKNHFRPIGYVLLLSTIYALIANLISETTFLGEIVLGIAEGGTNQETDALFNSVLHWIANNHAYSTVLFLPFFSLASFIAFKKYPYNFFEHFVINAYLSGQQAIIYSLFVLIQYLGNIEYYYFQLIPLSLSIGFAFWTLIQLYSSAGKVQSIFRVLLTYFLYFIIVIGIVLIGVIANIG